ncbi:MAG: DNA-3-methyladenine glycosylase [Candidatus Saccharimonadales bacterium]
MSLYQSLTQLPTAQAAQLLLGQTLVRSQGTTVLAARIVETEAYHQSDPAAHTFHGPSKRNQTMFGPAGHAYGMHHCLNVTAGEAGEGAGVLIRAIEPLEGLEAMARNRKLPRVVLDTADGIRQLGSGPGKLAQALGITLELNGHDLTRPPLQLIETGTVTPTSIVTTTRIGITKAASEPLRFYIKDSSFISRP